MHLNASTLMLGFALTTAALHGAEPASLESVMAELRAMREQLEGHQNWVVSLAYSPDGRRLISGAGDSTARVWDLKSDQELGRIRFPGNPTCVHSVGFSADGTYVLAAAEGGRLVVARAPAAPTLL